jgi:hypothetical protein
MRKRATPDNPMVSRIGLASPLLRVGELMLDEDEMPAFDIDKGRARNRQRWTLMARHFLWRHSAVAKPSRKKDGRQSTSRLHADPVQPAAQTSFVGTPLGLSVNTEINIPPAKPLRSIAILR